MEGGRLEKKENGREHSSGDLTSLIHVCTVHNTPYTVPDDISRLRDGARDESIHQYGRGALEGSVIVEADMLWPAIEKISCGRNKNGENIKIG